MSASILIIYCGGTIGMVPSVEGFQPSSEFATLLKQALAKDNLSNIDIVSTTPLIDSATAQPQNWLKIINTIHQYQTQYDGFVVLHGTDTLSYTAAAMALWCDDMGKPILITGAQRPMLCEGSDGLDNVLGAIHYARNTEFKQVGVYFGGLLLNPRATRKVHAQADRAFASPNAQIWGEKVNDECELYSQRLSKPTSIAPIAQLSSIDTEASRGSVALCHLSPDMSDDVIRAMFSSNTRAVVLLSYGVGNIPDNSVLSQCLQEALAKRTLIINCTQCFHGHTAQVTYAAGVGKMGVIEGQYATYEYAYVLSYFTTQLGLATQNVLTQLALVNNLADG